MSLRPPACPGLAWPRPSRPGPARAHLPGAEPPASSSRSSPGPTALSLRTRGARLRPASRSAPPRERGFARRAFFFLFFFFYPRAATVVGGGEAGGGGEERGREGKGRWEAPRSAHRPSVRPPARRSVAFPGCARWRPSRSPRPESEPEPQPQPRRWRRGWSGSGSPRRSCEGSWPP